MKILFLSHDASRTGAPIVFLSLLKWLKANSDIGIHVLLKSGGEIEEEFKEFDKLYLWESPKLVFSFFEKVLNRIKKPKTPKQNLIEQIKNESYDLIYANSVASSSVVLELKQHINTPVWMHIHELSISISQFCGLEVFKQVIPYLDKIIGVSKAVCNNLNDEYSIATEKQELVHAFVPTKILPVKPKGYLKNELKIPADSFIVGGSGTLDWRKGPDLFIQTANNLFKKDNNTNIIFVWLGGKTIGVEFEKLMYDIKRYGLEDKVYFPGIKSNAQDYFQDFDCFYLSSREDPFPLVCLENAALAKPVLCFENSGGMPEFVENDAGYSVEYGNTLLMADAILELYEDEEKKIKLGLQAQKKVKERHDVAIAGYTILNLIQNG